MKRWTYYNDTDPFAAQWLRNLIDAGEIPAGEVDERSIRDVCASDVVGFTSHHYFAGLGGWPLALRLAGWPEDRPVVTGSAPCQPFSAAGKGKGTTDERHLWPEFFRLIDAVRPPCVIGEQVANAIGHGWLDGVFRDLAAAGYECGACVLGAHSVGAPHIRQRLFWVAVSKSTGGRTDIGAVRSGTTEGIRNTEGKDERRAGEQARRLSNSGTANRANRLGDADRTGFADRAHAGTTGPCREATNGSAQGSSGEVGDTGCSVGRLDDTTSERAIDHRPNEPSGDGTHDGIPGAASADRMGESDRTGSQPGRIATEANGYGSAAVATGSWDAFRIIPCRDGKVRRVGAGVQPLAPRIPSKSSDPRMGFLLSKLAELEHSPEDSRRILREARGNRTGRLRGYGNAIVPQVAAEFIRAVMEIDR